MLVFTASPDFVRLVGHYGPKDECSDDKQRNPSYFDLPAKDEDRAVAKGKPDHYCQNAKKPQSDPELALRAGIIWHPLTTSKQTRNYWCTGKDSNLRSPKGRQIYSLLPLTTRPPVPIFKIRRQHCTLAHRAAPGNLRSIGANTYASGELPRRTGLIEPDSDNFDCLQDQPIKTFCPSQSSVSGGSRAVIEWSWRRDLNPRPSDYKSDALPAELRQP